MWLLQTNDPFKSTGTGGLNTSDVDITNFANKVQDAVKEALKPDQIATFFNSLESAAVKLNTTVGLGLAQNVKTFEKTIQSEPSYDVVEQMKLVLQKRKNKMALNQNFINANKI